jgi:seryl-tRNA synthetase
VTALEAFESSWTYRRTELVDAGLFLETGIDGLYGLSGAFESIITGLESRLADLALDERPTVVRFPPIMPRESFLQTDYLNSFPTMTGSIHNFDGGDAEHARLLSSLEAGRDWTSGLVPAETMLCSAVCHPLYATLPEVMPAGGARWDICGYVYRHEPSPDPARLQSFRQYEFVFVGEPEGAVAHRDRWLRRARTLLDGLGLDVRAEVANDPFFGRVGRMLAVNQQAEKLKYELVAPTSGAPGLTAIASANCHGDHFGATFGLQAATGETAHSSCIGFGLERIALALLWAHGLDPMGWPAPVRTQLGLNTTGVLA